MSLNNYFDKIFVINLDRRKDRLAFANKEFKKINTTFERFSAFDGSVNTPPHGLSINRGEYGAYNSHLNLLKYIIENKIERSLICEDDVVFCDDFINQFEAYHKQLPENTSLYYLSANNERANLEKVSDNIFKTVGSLALHAYSVDLKAAEDLVRRLESDYFDIPVDDVFIEHHKYNKTYIFYPNLAWQRPDFSDIREGFRNYDVVLKN